MSVQANKERIEAAFCRLRAGKMIIITDEKSREDEGDLVMAAERITPEAMNFMIRHGSGIVCLPMAATLLDRLRIPQMVTDNGARFQTPFTVSIEAAAGVTTGVSASDRARTVLAAVADNATADDVRMPGHVFPLRAQPGGVIARPGHTEASVDMMQMAGLKPAAVICEVMQENGEMSRGVALQRFASQYDLPIISMQEIIRYRYTHEDIMRLESSAAVPLQPHGLFQAQVFRNRFDGSEQVALRHGELHVDRPVLCRLHSECLTGDVFQSQRCDCGAQLDESLRRIAAEDGVLLYLRQEGRGIGLANKIKAYAMQEQGMDTVEANHHLGFAADAREYHMAAQMLLQMGIRQVRLLTNNPAKISALEEYGIEVVARERLEICANSANVRYLATKRDKLGHLIASLGAE